MNGFDYRVPTPADWSAGAPSFTQKTVKEWRAELRTALDQGGRRRVENGETAVYDKAGKLLFEVYGRLEA